MILYSELTSTFQILDYACTHSQLLLRSSKNKNRNHNIDILFKPVNVMLLPSRIEGLEISINDFPDKQQLLIDKYGFNLDYSNYIFRLKNTEGKSFFVNAMAFYVFHNNQITPCESGLKNGMGGYDYLFGESILDFNSSGLRSYK